MMFSVLLIVSTILASPDSDYTIMGESLCPLTGNKLPENESKQAVLYAAAVPSANMRECGHVCTMEALISYLDQASGVAKCPVCKNSFVISICDGVASRILRQELEPVGVNLVAFRYGRQIFWLTVADSDEGGSATTAQARIKEALDVGDDLQILHHGRPVFPDTAKSAAEVSETLVQISAEERQSRKKPSLVISGKRTGHWGTHAGRVRR